MNALEKKMVALLTEMRESHNVVGVKAEFEAEGTRLEEAMRLKEVSLKAGLGLTLKIGGCEAIKDMFEAASLGTEHLVAPMVETPYALKKYLQAVKLVVPGRSARGHGLPDQPGNDHGRSRTSTRCWRSPRSAA